MFTPEERERLRRELIAAAHEDERVTGAALTGSASVGAEDRWSDIDLFLGVAEGTDPAEVLAGWSEVMYTEHEALHHMDVRAGEVVYRVFLLANTLQVDIAFAPAAEFGATAPTFKTLFGNPVERQPNRPPDAAQLIDTGWLYALHARSSIARNRVWQAEYMVSGIRDNVLALACLRLGLPTRDGRGVDRLPPEITGPIAGTLVRSADAAELTRAFAAVIELLLAEIRTIDAGLATRLDAPLRELAGTR